MDNSLKLSGDSEKSTRTIPIHSQEAEVGNSDAPKPIVFALMPWKLSGDDPNSTCHVPVWVECDNH